MAANEEWEEAEQMESDGGRTTFREGQAANRETREKPVGV